MQLVYVIEDDEYLRIAIGEYLHSMEFIVVMFESGEKALRNLLASNEMPDLIVLGVEKSDGFKFLDDLYFNDFSMLIYVMYKNEDTLPKIMASNIIPGKGPIDLKEMVNVINERLRGVI